MPSTNTQQHLSKKARTLASLAADSPYSSSSEGGGKNTTESKTMGVMRPADDADRLGTALVIASALSHESDRYEVPRNLVLDLGGQTVICHNIWQLNLALYKRLVVVIGWKGADIRAQVEAMIASNPASFKNLDIDFVDQGRGWRGGFTASILAARSALGQDEKDFVLVGADHIISEGLLKKMAFIDIANDGDAACVLAETDLDGMVGLPRNIVQIALRPLHGADRIYKIGPHLSGAYGAIDAGCVRCTSQVLDELERLRAARPDTATLASALATFAERGNLRVEKTAGGMWFSVETEAEAMFTEENLAQKGHVHTLPDGRVVRLVGLPRRTKKSPVDGGEWSEFNVAKWRSAVFTTQSYFKQLYIDTTDFIASLCDNRGGTERVLLIELGCGTGEALTPLFSHAKYCIGLDFNPKFVNFCRSNVADEFQDKVKFIAGDAQNLAGILADPEQVPPEWVADTIKVVVCVGNTVGIMPTAVKDNVYQQMKVVAGTDGAFCVVFWNGNAFGDAVQNFYHKNPQLCGKFTGESINLDTCTLTTPSGYCTHWTKPAEARSVFETQIGAEVLRLEEKGRGVLVAGREPESGVRRHRKRKTSNASGSFNSGN